MSVDALTDILTDCQPTLGRCNDRYSIECWTSSGRHSVGMSLDVYIGRPVGRDRLSVDMSVECRSMVDECRSIYPS